MRSKVTILSFFLLAICGCSMGEYARLYDNKDLTKDDVAAIEVKGAVTILKIGNLFDLPSKLIRTENADYEKNQKFLVLPGEYDIEVGVSEEPQFTTFAGEKVIKLKFEAGRHYIFKGTLGDPDPSGSFIVSSKGSIAMTDLHDMPYNILKENGAVTRFSKWNLIVIEKDKDKIDIINTWIDF